MNNKYIFSIFESALKQVAGTQDYQLTFEKPNNPEHGDLSTNIAMKLAKTLHKSPQAIADEIINALEYDIKIIEFVEKAGAGFINIKYNNYFYQQQLAEIIKAGENFGSSNEGNNIKVNVEYVSVNPTGLLHLGHGRNAVIGDTIANLFEWLGYVVTREYYFNNAGNQMNNLAKSIFARYKQITGSLDYPFPDDGYHGEYIKEIANELLAEVNNNYINGTDDDLVAIRKYGEIWCFNKIKATLERLQIHQDVYYNEDSLYHEGKIDKLINDLKSKELAYEKDGALWFALTKLGLNDDRVIVKSTGEPTYRLPDIAYHREKFERGFDFLVDIFGADHIATVPDVLAGVRALGFDSDKIKVLIHQFVTLTENGEQVKMSKRTGKSYTLDDLIDEVGNDVVRFFLLMRGISTHLEFDLSLARQQSEKNPVYYLQYAHARICSIFDNAKEKSIELTNEVNYSLLNHKSELSLIKCLLDFPSMIQIACSKYEPQILADYLRELASAFHVFYHDCRIIIDDIDLMQARFKLAEMTKYAMRNGLTILGITIPERM